MKKITSEFATKNSNLLESIVSLIEKHSYYWKNDTNLKNSDYPSIERILSFYDDVKNIIGDDAVNINDLPSFDYLHDADFNFKLMEDSSKEKNAFVLLNEYYKDKKIKDIHKIEIEAFYPTLMIQLFKENILSYKNISYSNIYVWLCLNKNLIKEYLNKNIYLKKDTLQFLKHTINSYYGLGDSKIAEEKKLNFENWYQINIYGRCILSILKDKCDIDFVYGDTDTIYFLDNLMEKQNIGELLESMYFDYEYSFFNIGYFHSKKWLELIGFNVFGDKIYVKKGYSEKNNRLKVLEKNYEEFLSK